MLDLLLRRDPDNPVYLRKQGQLLLTGQRDEALRILQRAIQSAEGDPHAYFEVAEALRSQGAYADAVTYFPERVGARADQTDTGGSRSPRRSSSQASIGRRAVTDPL